MRPFSCVAIALACLAHPPAAAQTGSQPNLVLTILGGTVTGHHLWVVEKQPLQVLGDADPPKIDTLRLSRSIGSSLVLGAAATYFPHPHVGVHAEVSYVGLPIDNSCSGVYFHPDSAGGTINLRRNEQVCEDIQAQPADGGAVSLFTGVTLRAAPRGSFSPYLRANLGLVNQSRSTVDIAGAFVDSTTGRLFVRQVILDPKPRRTALLVGGAVGFTSPLGPGYQFRLEVRDQLVSLVRLTGPGSAGSSGTNPTESRLYHHISLTLGLDIVLERKRGRRY